MGCVFCAEHTLHFSKLRIYVKSPACLRQMLVIWLLWCFLVRSWESRKWHRSGENRRRTARSNLRGQEFARMIKLVLVGDKAPWGWGGKLPFYSISSFTSFNLSILSKDFVACCSLQSVIFSVKDNSEWFTMTESLIEKGMIFFVSTAWHLVYRIRSQALSKN